jgi:hypothetical protein
MSADKHKKKQRAFEMLRDHRRWVRHDGPMSFHFSGTPSAAMRWLVEKGHAVITRRARHPAGLAGRNVFTELS